jgi:hypothetical protein
MTPAERAIWYEILKSKPASWFDAGSLLLLERYCCLAIQARQLTVELRTADDRPAIRSIIRKELNQVSMCMTALAAKCRLSVQSVVDVKSRMLDEKGQKEEEANLLGGGDTWGVAKLRAVK